MHNPTVTREFGDEHAGRDYLAAQGTVIRSTLAGVVVQVNGGEVVVESNGIRHSYSHLADAEVQVADTVETGDRLGLATGPHLHYEERVVPYQVGDDRSPLFDLHPNTRLP